MGKSGIASGVINMIHGGKEIVQGLCKHPLNKGLGYFY